MSTSPQRMADNGPEVLQILDQEFVNLLGTLRELTSTVPPAVLYQHPPAVSVGEHILRSAAVVEQTFGGLTVNLWDDPFEWTLPETLSSRDLITEYLNEVDQSRQRAFMTFANDGALVKYVSVPAGEPRSVLSVLLEALTRAADYRGRAIATLKILSVVRPSRFII